MKTKVFTMTWCILLFSIFFFSGCASKQKKEIASPLGEAKESTTGTTAPAPNKAPCQPAATNQPIRIECSDEPKLVLELDKLEFIDANGRGRIPATALKDKDAYLMVGDFRPGWDKGEKGKIVGDRAEFPLGSFANFEGPHRLTIRIGGENVWLFLEGLDQTLELVSLGFEQDWKESVSIGIWVNADGSIIPFKKNPEGADHMMIRAGFMGPWKRINVRPTDTK